MLKEQWPHGIMFHHFHGGIHLCGQGSLSAENFERLLRYIGLDSILPAREWRQKALNGSLQAGQVCLTFDDALRCQYDIAEPVLEKFGLTAFWFVYSSIFEGNIEPLEIYRHFRGVCFSSVEEFYDEFFHHVERIFPNEHAFALKNFHPEVYLSNFPFYTLDDRRFRYLRDMILGVEKYRQIMDGMLMEKKVKSSEWTELLWMKNSHLLDLQAKDHIIGLHSYSHPTKLAGLSPEDQYLEYFKNYQHLQSILQEPPTSMSHPCNSYNEETLEILKELGVTLGFRSNMAEMAGRSQWEFPREDHANLMRDILKAGYN